MPRGIPNNKDEKDNAQNQGLSNNDTSPNSNQNIQPPTEVVQVKKDDLQKLLDRIDKIEKENQKLSAIADVGRLAHYEATHRETSSKVYRVSTYQDKIITSWEMVQNKVWKDPQGEWQEKQEIEITTEDGSKAILPYIEFVTNTHKVEASLVSTTQKGNKTYLELNVQGRKLLLDSTYVN